MAVRGKTRIERSLMQLIQIAKKSDNPQEAAAAAAYEAAIERESKVMKVA